MPSSGSGPGTAIVADFVAETVAEPPQRRLHGHPV